MNIVVPVKVVPDLVDELEITGDGNALDMTFMRMALNESDDHAIEQAILLKERGEATVTVMIPDVEDAERILYTAVAKGADQPIKLTGDFEDAVNNHALARVFARAVKEKELKPDLVLTGVQAHDDLDGSLGPLLAEYLEMPYVGYVSGVTLTDGKATVRKEYPGGLIAEMEVTLPAVLGIQAAEQPPRYVAISKTSQAMKIGGIVEHAVEELDPSGGPTVSRMSQPEVGERAEMIDGDEDKVATRLIEIFKELGVV